MSINYNGASIYFETQGEGNPLVLLHGFLEDSRIWEPFVKELQKDRQVICIDLPGHGKSDGFINKTSIAELAKVVSKVLKSLGIQRLSIAGHSMGGYVCLEFLKNFPMMSKSLVLINSTPIEDTVEKRKIRERSVKLVSKNKDAYISMAISNLFSEKSKEEHSLEIELLKDSAKHMSSENIQAALKSMKIRTNNKVVLKQFSGQKIIVAAEEDPILDFNELKSIGAECNCDFFTLKNGHNSYIEDLINLTKIMQFID